MDEFYNHHYIRTDASGNIVEGWSDGPFNRREATEDDICINDKGGYQFRLFSDGEENPPLFDSMTRIPLYKWDGKKVVRRTNEELDVEREAWRAERKRLASLPTESEQLRADVDYLLAMEGLT